MDASSPLSSPPASSVGYENERESERRDEREDDRKYGAGSGNGYESRGYEPLIMDDDSSEIDLVFVSSGESPVPEERQQVQLAQPAAQQAPMPAPESHVAAPEAVERSESAAEPVDELVQELVPESVEEVIKEPYPEPVEEVTSKVVAESITVFVEDTPTAAPEVEELPQTDAPPSLAKQSETLQPDMELDPEPELNPEPEQETAPEEEQGPEQMAEPESEPAPESAPEPAGSETKPEPKTSEPEPEVEPEIIVAASVEARLSSPPRYTKSAFALVISSSPEKAEKEHDTHGEALAEVHKEEIQVKTDKMEIDEKDGQTPEERQKEDEPKELAKEEPKEEPKERPADTRKSRPRQQRSKTPANDPPAEPIDVDAEVVVVPTEVVTTTRSGRRVVQKRHADEAPSPAKPVKKPAPTKQKPQKTPATAKTPARAKAPAKAPAKTKTPSKSAAKQEASPTATVLRQRKQAAARWQTGFVLANTRSPLVHFDLRTLLCQPEAWTLLSADEQREVLMLLPPTAKVLDAGTPDARPDIDSLKNDNNFRHDCARYRSDLEAGFYNTKWLEEAFEAHAMRQEGVFDEYVLKAFETSWGVAVPGGPEDKTGETGEAVQHRTSEAVELPKTSLKRSRQASLENRDEEAKPVERMEEDTHEDSADKGGTNENEGQEGDDIHEKRSPKRQKQTPDSVEDGDVQASVSVPDRSVKRATPGLEVTDKSEKIREDVRENVREEVVQDT